MVLVEVERVKMVVVCRSAGIVVCLECFQRDLRIQKSCVDCLPVVLRQRKADLMSLLGSKQTSVGLEGPGFCSSTMMKDVGCDDADANLYGC